MSEAKNEASELMSLLCVGDKVRIDGPKVGYPCGDFLWVEGMDEYRGNETEVDAIHSREHVALKIDKDFYGWHPLYLTKIGA